ncbi:MAG: hypothetical protein JEZ06_15250 [Anaerolineaceae bacterium]|nr:hypothetical protein [Anaerolineaceae bacterium]
MNWKIKLTFVLTLLFCSLACNLPFLMENDISPSDKEKDSNPPDENTPGLLIENYDPHQENVHLGSYIYLLDQVEFIGTGASPTRFKIIFTEDSRQETWYYDNIGYTVVFIDGATVAEKPEPCEYKEQMYATNYTPAMFYAGMGMDEIVVATGKQTFHLTDIDELIENGQIMHIEGLSILLVGNQIRSVITHPAVTERLLLEEEFENIQ